jgi:four helix bundle protein
MRLSAVSVPASILEGYRENNRKKQMKLFCSARVSLEKTRHYLLVSGKLNFGDASSLINEVDEMARLLSETTIVAKHIKNNNIAC